MIIKAKHAVITYIIGLSLVSVTGMAQADDAGMEKCYGVAKAGMNDCDTTAPSCDKSVIDADPNYFLLVPTGICNKIVGGMLMNSTTPAAGKGYINTMSPPATTMPMTVPPVPATTVPATNDAGMSTGTSSGTTTNSTGTGVTTGY